jgi:hypothetical protein
MESAAYSLRLLFPLRNPQREFTRVVVERPVNALDLECTLSFKRAVWQ